MPAIAAIKTSSIIAGTESTTSATVGVDKTFDPEGFMLPGVARWCDRSGGIAIGYPRFSLSVRPPTKTSRVYKVTAKLVLPTLEVTAPSTATGIQPAPTKAYDCLCVMEFMLPERSTAVERAALLSHVRSLLATTVQASDASPSDATGSPLIAAVTNFEPAY
ncbi:TPA_asm: coat protein [ssRNA phage Gerhypos.4_2]|uniref:Coat protein n=2 Tax=Fiersviridae TaxID=2842319 RepID=A0A8S5KZM6_9VIRU|nr:coat protein [ssRNA phage Gerhypos.4_2]QDH89489.1 MAG: hypothetical protein H4Bulk46183_000004 [Leviviridae sp.]DAD50533.1 TPA_asm: coat protein [ssRNA phage Gerhypos.4_2]